MTWNRVAKDFWILRRFLRVHLWFWNHSQFPRISFDQGNWTASKSSQNSKFLNPKDSQFPVILTELFLIVGIKKNFKKWASHRKFSSDSIKPARFLLHIRRQLSSLHTSVFSSDRLLFHLLDPDCCGKKTVNLKKVPFLKKKKRERDRGLIPGSSNGNPMPLLTGGLWRRSWGKQLENVIIEI